MQDKKMKTEIVLLAVPAEMLLEAGIGNRITDLRIERRKKLTEDEDDILLDTLKELNGILDEYEPTAEFNNDLFEQIVQDITVNDNTQITFRLLGDIQLTEKINEKGRCKSA